jgi:glycine/D-amino acid oxidase-like deaminating enzyme
MPGPPVTPIASDPTLPGRVDVVVVGGGIIGASTALELAEKGVSVLLCEKGRIGAEQSSRNWGWVRVSLRDPNEIPLMIHSVRLWEGLDRRTRAKTGYTRTGIFWPAPTRRKQRNYETWAQHLTALGMQCPMLSGAETDRLFEGHTMSARTGMFAPLDGRAEPQWATTAIAGAVRSAGGNLVTHCAVRSIEQSAGRISGVITERGLVACDAVVIAGGAWSRLFAGNAGVELPQLKVLNSVLRTTPVADGPGPAVGADGYSLRKRTDGGYTVAAGTETAVDIVPDSFRLARVFLPALMGERRNLRFRLSARWLDEMRAPRRWDADEVTPFENCRVLDPAPCQRTLRRGWARAQDAFPALRAASIAQSWAGMIDVTPDALPVISPVEVVPGLHIATGFSGHGFGIGPGAGRLMADLVMGETPLVDPHDFRLSRFTDGSIIRPQSGY